MQLAQLVRALKYKAPAQLPAPSLQLVDAAYIKVYTVYIFDKSVRLMG